MFTIYLIYNSDIRFLIPFYGKFCIIIRTKKQYDNGGKELSNLLKSIFKVLPDYSVACIVQELKPLVCFCTT